jgi:putative selenate reductase FAD-binding subunit
MIGEILRPRSVREALRAVATPGAACLGGGTWLLSGAAPEVTRLVSLEHLDLGRIVEERGRVVLGASVTLQQIVDSPLVHPALRAGARLIASRTLRAMKTLGGALGRRAADSPILPILVALRAEVSTAGRRGATGIESYLASRPGGIVLTVTLPEADRTCAFRAVSRASHCPLSLFVAVSARAGMTEPVVVASDCVSPLVRLSGVEKALRAAAGPDLELMASAAFAPAPDPRASVAYKRYLAGVHVAGCRAEIAGGEARA